MAVACGSNSGTTLITAVVRVTWARLSVHSTLAKKEGKGERERVRLTPVSYHYYYYYHLPASGGKEGKAGRGKRGEGEEKKVSSKS